MSFYVLKIHVRSNLVVCSVLTTIVCIRLIPSLFLAAIETVMNDITEVRARSMHVTMADAQGHVTEVDEGRAQLIMTAA